MLGETTTRDLEPKISSISKEYHQIFPALILALAKKSLQITPPPPVRSCFSSRAKWYPRPQDAVGLAPIGACPGSREHVHASNRCYPHGCGHERQRSHKPRRTTGARGRQPRNTHLRGAVAIRVYGDFLGRQSARNRSESESSTSGCPSAVLWSRCAQPSTLLHKPSRALTDPEQASTVWGDDQPPFGPPRPRGQEP